MFRQIWRDLLIKQPEKLGQQSEKMLVSGFKDDRLTDALTIVVTVAVCVILVSLGWQFLH